MPWSIKNQNGKFCVVSDTTGKVEKCHPDKAAATAHQKALYANVSDAKKKLEEETVGSGPALIAVAATIKPHLGQRDGEMSITSDGKVRIPIARKGIYNHSKYGKIIFTDSVFDKMIENHNKKVTKGPVYLDLRHGENAGALAMLDVDKGGSLTKEGSWLVGYATPVDEDTQRYIRKYPLTSPEFQYNYRSDVVRYLSDDLTEVDEEDLVELEEIMPVEFKAGELVIQLEQTDVGLTITQEDLDKIKASVEKTGSRLTSIEVELDAAKAKIKELEPAPPVELPAEVQQRLEMLEEANKTLRLQAVKERSEAILAKAEGKGLAKPLLDLFGKVIRMEALGDDGTIKLENKPGSIRDYLASAVSTLVDEIQGTVNTEHRTRGESYQLERNGQPTDEEWEEAFEKAWD